MKEGLLFQLFVLFITPILFVDSLSAQKDIANYKMDLVLNDDDKSINGHTVLTWRNTSNVPVNSLHFHLYYNAFRNNRSTYFEGNNNRMDFLNADKEDHWGWSEIKSIKDQNGAALEQSYIQPDDGNLEDKTVLRVQLENPIMPGETQVFEYDWLAKIPKIMPRTGHNRDFIFMAQWFPKVGVFESAGMRGRTDAGWNCRQYHASGEYYADFGSYDLTVDLPAKYKFGSSGLLQKVEDQGDRKIWYTQAKDVIDFTWTASPHFQEFKDEWNGIELNLLAYPEHAHYAERYFGAIKNAMSFLDAHVGAYPYPKLTIVDVPLHGLFTGGMEYPMLISSFGACFMPEGIKVTEILAIHEFIHQYFMQMVATNETEDPWMDEGITTYYECRIVDKYYGHQSSAIDFLGITAGNFDYNRYELLNSQNQSVAPGKYKSWEFPNGAYGDVAYNKMGSILKTLEAELGTGVFDECMKLYFETWKFRHPGPQDFVDVFNQYVESHLQDKYPNGLDWFFDQTIFNDGYCDYLVSRFNSFSPVADQGVFDITKGVDKTIEPIDDREIFISEIFLKRKGNIVIPTEVLLSFEDGSTETIQWDAVLTDDKIRLSRNSKLISVEIDPNGKNDLDTNILNNSKRLKKNSITANKYAVKIQSLLQFALEFASAIF